MIRNPVVAGQFYSGNAEILEKEVNRYLNVKAQKINAIGCLSPHAGYMCSGRVAGAVFSSIIPKDTYVMLGANHTGIGKRFGLDLDSRWVTPLGNAEIDKDLGQAILDDSKLIKKDRSCHFSEHSIEVQLPFLQATNKEFRFVPIIISQGKEEEYAEIAKTLAKAVKSSKKNITIVASGDMTHYEPDNVAKEKDKLAIDKMLGLDVKGFLKTVEEHSITACGVAPTAVMISASMELGAKEAKLIKYETSGDVLGDRSSVVGYAGIVIY